MDDIPFDSSKKSPRRGPEGWRAEAGDLPLGRRAVSGARSSPRGWRLLNVRTLVVALAVLALAQAALIGRLLSARADAPAPTLPVPVTILSGRGGDVVTVDGREVGVTPYRMNVDASVHAIGLARPPQALEADRGGPPVPPSPVGAPARPPEPTAAVAPALDARPRSGSLRLSSAIELQVIEEERLLGSSANPVVMPAGVHHLALVNAALGFREERAVDIKAGEVIALAVKLPDGQLNINAVPWAEVWIDGKQAGETPLANVSVPIGAHDVVFRHPQLGERRVTTTVKSGAATRVSVTLTP
jgi:hypothetical protein